MSKDYYKILGVSKSASGDEIKKAFRRLAHEHHPDKGGQAERFKDINEAYQVLSDRDKRTQYDQFGSAAFEQGGMGAGGQWAGGFPGGFNVNFEDMGDLGDVFGSMFGFGGSRSRSAASRGQDIEVDLTLNFLDAVFGAKQKIRLYKDDRCEACHGSGAAPGTKVITCTSCHGKGRVPHVQRTILGSIETVAMCKECFGVGKKPEHDCKECRGKGAARHERELPLDIPPGVDNGVSLRIQGEGAYPGHEGVSGDLFVRLHVKTHPIFKRDGDAIHTSVSVPYSVLSLGGSVEIETVDGPGSLNIPEFTQPGTVFRIRQKGVPHSGGRGRGDQFVTVNSAIPKKLSREQREALDNLRKTGL